MCFIKKKTPILLIAACMTYWLLSPMAYSYGNQNT